MATHNVRVNPASSGQATRSIDATTYLIFDGKPLRTADFRGRANGAASL
jgi:hypothetical protein